MLNNSGLNNILGQRVRALRKEAGLSISGLAEKSGISKASLSVLEDGRGNPTISTIWRLANALEIPFGDLAGLEPGEKGGMVEGEGIVVRLIEQNRGFPFVETYLMKLSPGASRNAGPHFAGVMEKVMVLKGRALTGAINSPKEISTGEIHEFKADSPHIYKASDGAATLMISVEYPDGEVSDTYTRSMTLDKGVELKDIRSFINRHLDGVICGVGMCRLVFRARGGDFEKISLDILSIVNEINNGGPLPVTLFPDKGERELVLFIFPNFNSSKLKPSGDGDNSIPFFESSLLRSVESAMAGMDLKEGEVLLVGNGQYHSYFSKSDLFKKSGHPWCGFEDLKCQNNLGAYKLIICPSLFGEDSYTFFQNCSSLIQSEGRLVILNGLVSGFSNEEERTANLISHCLNSITGMISSVPGEETGGLSNSLIKELQVIKFEAFSGMVDSALFRLKRISDSFDSGADFGVACKDEYFIKTELESLLSLLERGGTGVIGFEQFVFLAGCGGFHPSGYEKVYSTTGFGETEGGYYVFTFSKKS